jgi:glycine/D-amino acid oxidase-like deaminating enzyme
MSNDIFTDDVKFEAYWWEAAPRFQETPPDLPERTDVAVVGSGYSGLSAALTCARGGRHVTVFESGDVGQGASSRNGGMCGTGLKVGFTDLAAKIGLKDAVAFYRDGQVALDYLEHLIESEQIHCHFSRMGHFSGAHVPSHYEGMARDSEALNKHLGVESTMIPRAEQHKEIGTDRYYGGIVAPREAGLHPALYHQGLLERVRATDTLVAGNTPVTNISRDGDDFTITTPRGRVVARNVVIATNGYTDRAAGWFRRRLVPIGTYMIATEPVAPEVMARLAPTMRMLSDSKNILYYFRPSPDGTRILFGGRAAFANNDQRVTGARLRRFMLSVWPELADLKITHSWAGNVAFTLDKLPHVGVQDGMHYAIGYCGSGVVKATYLGHKAAQSILGHSDAASPLMNRDFQALPLYNGTPWFLPLVAMYYNLADRFAK